MCCKPKDTKNVGFLDFFIGCLAHEWSVIEYHEINCSFVECERSGNN